MKLLAFSEIYMTYWCTKGKTKINKRAAQALDCSHLILNYLWCPVSLTNAYRCTHLITINTYITGDKLVKKRRNNKSECRRDLDLKEDSEEACLRKRVPGDRSFVLKGSLPQGPLAHAWSMEDPSIQG